MQGLQTTFHLQKYLITQISIMPMPSIVFSSHFALGEEVIIMMVRKLWTFMCCLILHLATNVIASFDIQMFKGGVNTFALVIYYANESWTFIHVIVDLFEEFDTTGLSMARQLQDLLKTFDLIHCVVVFLKDETINLISIVTTLDYIVDCHLLKLQWVYEGFCCIHVMFKAC